MPQPNYLILFTWMFVKVYSYKINRSELIALRKINARASEIYSRYGELKAELLFKSDAKLVDILYMEFYKSKKECERIINQVNGDPDLQKPWEDFQAILVGKIKSDEYELL